MSPALFSGDFLQLAPGLGIEAGLRFEDARFAALSVGLSTNYAVPLTNERLEFPIFREELERDYPNEPTLQGLRDGIDTFIHGTRIIHNFSYISILLALRFRFFVNNIPGLRIGLNVAMGNGWVSAQIDDVITLRHAADGLDEIRLSRPAPSLEFSIRRLGLGADLEVSREGGMQLLLSANVDFVMSAVVSGLTLLSAGMTLHFGLPQAYQAEETTTQMDRPDQPIIPTNCVTIPARDPLADIINPWAPRDTATPGESSDER